LHDESGRLEAPEFTLHGAIAGSGDREDLLHVEGTIDLAVQPTEHPALRGGEQRRGRPGNRAFIAFCFRLRRGG
jgi:hypothetical protein